MSPPPTIIIAGSYFNADAAFDTKAARWTCFNHQLIPNIVENFRSRKRPKRGRKRHFDAAIYKKRFISERSFAWIDKFRALLLRFDRKAAHFLGVSSSPLSTCAIYSLLKKLESVHYLFSKIIDLKKINGLL